MMASAASSTWPPSADQVMAWLGGARRVVCRRPQPVAPGWAEQLVLCLARLLMAAAMALTLLASAAVASLLWLRVSLWAFARLGTTLLVMYAALPAVLAGLVLIGGRPSGSRPRQRRSPAADEPLLLDARTMAVEADGARIVVRTLHSDRGVSWSSLVGLRRRNGTIELRCETGETVRLPDVDALVPVLRAARRVLAARRLHGAGRLGEADKAPQAGPNAHRRPSAMALGALLLLCFVVLDLLDGDPSAFLEVVLPVVGMTVFVILAACAMVLSMRKPATDAGQADASQPEAPPRPELLVVATDRDLTVRAGDFEQCEPWSDLMRVEDHISAVVLRYADGAMLRVPAERQYAAVIAQARVAAKLWAERDRALRRLMQRGLSRPSADEPADRALSRTEP